jgi:hypothetical protein
MYGMGVHNWCSQTTDYLFILFNAANLQVIGMVQLRDKHPIIYNKMYNLL